jgi:hypothetical protein
MSYCVGDGSKVYFSGSIRYCPFLAEKVISRKFFSRPPRQIGRLLWWALADGIAPLKFWNEFEFFGVQGTKGEWTDKSWLN